MFTGSDLKQSRKNYGSRPLEQVVLVKKPPNEERPVVKCAVCVGMSEQSTVHLCNTVKLQFQDPDADCVKLSPLTAQYTCSMSAELQL